ncbi:hypothetical protein K1T71_014895 [Dendrolimus kikuchii]|nr:hypothetical protein K1T71_014895 [Dendrolimus kikuchii]
MVLLHGIEDMVRTKTIILHQVCTQKLMDFKRPSKVFFESPIQAQHMPIKRKWMVNYSPLQEHDIMDNYQDYFTNLAVSYGNTTMPILQMVKPANPYAIEWDHNYLEESVKDQFLKELALINITKQKIMDVERNTREQYRCHEWHKMRSCRITASNFYTVIHSKPNTQEHLVQKMLFCD